jgi:thiol-disulfide isomerase/thioredoxin
MSGMRFRKALLRNFSRGWEHCRVLNAGMPAMGFKPGTLLTIGLVGVALSGAAFGQSGADTQQKPPLAVGTQAPDFTTRTLDGDRLTLRSMRGDVVLVDFWATWCGPCRMATPTLVHLYHRFGRRGLRIVGLSLDDFDSRAQIGPYEKTFGVRYTLAYAPGPNFDTGIRYHTNYDPDTNTFIGHPVPPSLFVIDRKGRVRWSQIGYSIAEEQELTPLIAKLLSVPRRSHGQVHNYAR